MAQDSPQLTTWKQWLMPRPIDGLAAVLYAGVLVVYGYFILYQLADPWLCTALMVTAILSLILIDRVEYIYFGEQPPWQVTFTFLLARMVIIIVASFCDGLGLLPYQTYFALIIPFGFFFLSGSSYGLSGIVWTMYLIGRWRSTIVEPVRPDEPTFIFDLTFAMMLLFIFSIAYLIRQERTSRFKAEKLLGDLETSHRQLQEYAEQVAELATIEERNRLAREIHDSLGHYMTVINVQLEKAIAFRDRNPQEADEAVGAAKHLAGQALKDIRRSVGTLRSSPEQFSLTESLNELVGYMESSQFSVELDIVGDEAGFSRQSLTTLYRAAQEGLTNIQKHAQASQATVQVRLEGDEAKLYIIDNGRGFDPTVVQDNKNGSHYGLQGIRERLELIRGSLSLESGPNQGTTLFVTVPKNPLLLVGR